MTSPERLFNAEFRILTQSSTKNVAKDRRKNLGEDLVKSYVKVIFCAKPHNVSSERITMQKKIIIMLPSKKEKICMQQRKKKVYLPS